MRGSLRWLTAVGGRPLCQCKLCVAELQRVRAAEEIDERAVSLVVASLDSHGTMGGGDVLALDWRLAARGRFNNKRQRDKASGVAKRRAPVGGDRHKLELARLAHPSWCHICHSLLWLPDGVDVARCSLTRCAFVAHCSCLGATARADSIAIAGAPATCASMRSAAGDGYAGAAFGRTLAESVAGRRNLLPIVVQDSVLFLLAHMADEEGILRHSGSHAHIGKLAAAYNSGAAVQLAGSDPHSVVGVFKLFFRDLKDRLVPPPLDEQIQDDLADAKRRGDSAEQQALYLRDKLAKLPRANFELCKFLTFFFIELERHSARNKMTRENLMICTAPTLQCPAAVFLLGMRHFETIFGRQANSAQHTAENKFSMFDKATF